MTAPIEARSLRVRLGGNEILHDVSLTVRPGEVVALLGANGSGKSTLVRAIAGIVPPSSGTVHLYGRPIGPTVPWQRVGYVPQRVSAAAGMASTAAEVVSSGLLHGRLLRLPRDWRARAATALDQVGLADRAEDDVATLSGGQQQRVLIARALARSPELLILDEPVAGVDAPSQEALAATLTHLVQDTGLTVLVVLHEIGVLAPLITRALVLRHGRVVHDGAPPPAAGTHAGIAHDHVHPHQATTPAGGTATALTPHGPDTTPGTRPR